MKKRLGSQINNKRVYKHEMKESLAHHVLFVRRRPPAAGRWPLSTRAARSATAAAAPAEAQGTRVLAKSMAVVRTVDSHIAPHGERATAHNPLCNQTVHASHQHVLVLQAASEAVKELEELLNHSRKE